MLDYTKEDLQELGAEITTREIYQQPSVWKETARLYQERQAEIKAFLETSLKIFLLIFHVSLYYLYDI